MYRILILTVYNFNCKLLSSAVGMTMSVFIQCYTNKLYVCMYWSLATGGTTAIVSPPTASLRGAARGTRGIVAQPSLGQGGHKLGILLPSFCHSFPPGQLLPLP